jgi:hypothetical protein
MRDAVNDFIPRRFQPLVFGSLLVAVVILAFANLRTEEGEQGSPVALVITLIIVAAATIALWWALMQPALAGRRPAARDALIVSVLALLVGFFYWTGLVWVLAPAAIVLGTLAREGEASRARAEAGPDPAADVVPADKKTGTAALALGWVALVGATLLGIVDGVF